MQAQKTKAKLDTLASAIESNKALPPDLWDTFLHSVDPKRNDKRKAILFAALGFCIFAIAWLLPFQDMQGRYLLTYMSLIPIVFSCIYFAFWRFGYQKE
jgi:hypothetical protein